MDSLYNMDSGCFANWMRCQNLQCDGTLETEDGGVFNIHVVQVSPSSEYFRALYFSSFTSSNNCDQRTVLIPGIRKDTMENILQYIYCKNTTLSDTNVCDILIASDYLRIKDLVVFCCGYMTYNVSPENCLDFYKVAIQLEHLEISKPFYKYILLHFMEVSVNTRAFQDTSFPILMEFLQEDRLNCNEVQVWKAIRRWLLYEPLERAHFLLDLLSCLRIAQLEEDFVVQEIVHQSLFRDNEFCRDIIQRMAHYTTTFPEMDYRQRLMTSLMVHCGRELNFMPRAPKEIVFIITDVKIDEAGTGGCNIYEMYDSDFDIYKSVGSGENFYPRSNCFVGSTIILFDSWSNEIITLDVITKTWGILPPLEVERYEYELVSVRGCAFALGGYNFQPVTINTTVEVYDPESNRWFQKSPMLLPHHGPALEYDGMIYIAGELLSTDSNGQNSMAIEKYNPETDTWFFISKPTITRRNFTFTAYDKHLYIAGGQNCTGELSAVERYDFASDIWTRITDLPISFHLPTSTVVNGLFVIAESYSSEEESSDSSYPLYLDDGSGSWCRLDVNKAPWMDYACGCYKYPQFSILRDSEVIRLLRQGEWQIE